MVNAHTLLADDAAVAMTCSPDLPGNATLVHVDPLRSQAVGEMPPSNAQPPFLPAVVSAVKSANTPPCTVLTVRHAGLDAARLDAFAVAAAEALAPMAKSPRPRGLRRDPRSVGHDAGASASLRIQIVPPGPHFHCRHACDSSNP